MHQFYFTFHWLSIYKCWVKVSLPNAGLACILGISMHEFFGTKTVLISSASCLFVPFERVQKGCTCRSAVPLGIRTFAAKNQQLEDLDFMFVLRKERCLRLSTTSCEERTGGKGVVGAPGRQQARSRKRGSHLTPPTICDVFFGG